MWKKGEDNMQESFVQVYTGNGKGKSTAAFGLALRAHFAGKKVYIGQFVKDMKYHETEVEKVVDGIKIEQFGAGCFINRKPSEVDKDLAKKALVRCGNILKNGEYDLVILDEINIALFFKLFSPQEVIKVLKERNPKVEAVLTGRYAPQEIIDFADLVTEMKEVKHYYSKGVLSRDGIDV
ncbi:cob(I)yrinic acid a,c-diamide adenosyltransferase [Hathewaya limosa]